VPDAAARMRAVVEGQVDLATDVPPDSVPDLKRRRGIQVLEAPGLREMFLGFDVAHAVSPHVQAPANPFRDRRVREAVSLAVDRQRLVQVVFKGHGDPATQVVPRSAFGFDPARPLPARDVARARALLAEAGYPQGFAVTLHHPSGVYVADDATASFVADALSEIGVRVTRQPLAKQPFFDALTRHEPALYLMTWNCLSNDSQEVLSFLLHSADPEHGYGTENAGGYANPALDRVIEQADQAMYPITRLELLRQAEDIALDDFAWVPLAVPSTIYALREPFRWVPRPDRRIAVEEIAIAR
jgi:peptide/nickel transport system substrate-binding protein